LAVLEDKQEKAKELMSDVLVHVRESWESKTTANNLKFIREHREQKGLECGWIKELENLLV